MFQNREPDAKSDTTVTEDERAEYAGYLRANKFVAILKTRSAASRLLPILDDHIWSAPAEVRFIGTTTALWIALRIDRKCRRGPFEIGRQSKAPSPLRSAGALQIRYASLLMTAPALVRFADSHSLTRI